MQATLSSLKLRIRQLRQGNLGRFIPLKAAMIAVYPLVIIAICELCLFSSFGSFFSYFRSHLNVLFFVTLFECAIYISLLFVSKSAVVATAINSLILFVLTAIEYYKFGTTGTHLVITDLAMAGNALDILQFATIEVSLRLVVAFFTLITYSVVLYFLNCSFRIRYIKSLAVGCLSLALTVSMFTIPAFSMEIYNAFDINDELTKDSFSSNDRFSKNRFLTFLIQSTTDIFRYRIGEPDTYSSELVFKTLSQDEQARKDDDASALPNLMFILSESFGDFRQLEQAVRSLPGGDALKIPELPEDCYDNFDRMASEGFKGVSILPTFGSYTVRSEFEMMFGLPTLSLNSPTIPHYMLKDRDEQPTLVRLFKNAGYNTTYIHPFGGSSYNRSEIYTKYGFDRLIFEENFDVDIKRFKGYISDHSLFEQALEVMRSTPGSDYIMNMSMHNHMPFTLRNELGDVISDERTEYFKGVSQTDEALGYLMEQLKSFEEPTIVVFSGDHFPFFTDENSIYRRLSIDKDNSFVLYRSSYIIWSNYPLDYSRLPAQADELSIFYIPYAVMELAGIPKDEFALTMTQQMAISPIYSINTSAPCARNAVIDLLTYDRVLGKNYSDTNQYGR